MPSLTELSDLFEVLPELPPPVPRRRTAFQDKPQSAPVATKTPSASTRHSPPPSLIQRLFPWVFPVPSADPHPRKANPFAVLKAGKKMIVVAAVDAGTISFFRFGQGAFDDFPMN